MRTLRQKLRLAWGLEPTTGGDDQLHRAVKLFPMRVINGGAAQALTSVTMMKLPTPPWLSALAYELEAARDAATSNMLAVVRPWLEVEYRNRHFYATEAMEGIVMQLFLLDVRKRCFAPSIIWLHDGFWIDKQVADEVLVAAEKYVRSRLFPQSGNSEPLFRILDLTEARDAVLHSQTFSPIGPLFPTSRWKDNISRQSPKCLTRQFPVAKFVHKIGSKRKISTYFHRVSKRAQLFRLRS